MTTCATCKHWKPQGIFETGHALELGSCQATPMFWESTQWSKDGTRREFTAEHQQTTAFAQDGSDYSASLLTKPAHGCTMHAGKDEG